MRLSVSLTRERGKLSAFARGARASRRRFAGVLEPFHLLSAEIAERGGDLWSLESASVEEAFGEVRGDLLRIAIQLAEAVGARLAELTQAEWGMVSSGCAAGWVRRLSRP